MHHYFVTKQTPQARLDLKKKTSFTNTMIQCIEKKNYNNYSTTILQIKYANLISLWDMRHIDRNRIVFFYSCPKMIFCRCRPQQRTRGNTNIKIQVI